MCSSAFDNHVHFQNGKTTFQDPAGKIGLLGGIRIYTRGSNSRNPIAYALPEEAE